MVNGTQICIVSTYYIFFQQLVVTLTGVPLNTCLTKPRDTVGQPQSAEMCVSHMPSLKAKKLGKLAQEKVLLER